MLNRRIFAVALAVGLSVAAGIASAADRTPYSQAAFEAAQKAGKPILVEVTAPWCPTCRAQKPILSELTGRSSFGRVAVFEVDFDSQKEVLRALHVQQQSTLICFKGSKEVVRSTGVTDPATLKTQLDTLI